MPEKIYFVDILVVGFDSRRVDSMSEFDVLITLSWYHKTIKVGTVFTKVL